MHRVQTYLFGITRGGKKTADPRGTVEDQSNNRGRERGGGGGGKGGKGRGDDGNAMKKLDRLL